MRYIAIILSFVTLSVSFGKEKHKAYSHNKGVTNYKQTNKSLSKQKANRKQSHWKHSHKPMHSGLTNRFSLKGSHRYYSNTKLAKFNAPSKSGHLYHSDSHHNYMK